MHVSVVYGFYSFSFALILPKSAWPGGFGVGDALYSALISLSCTWVARRRDLIHQLVCYRQQSKVNSVHTCVHDSSPLCEILCVWSRNLKITPFLHVHGHSRPVIASTHASYMLLSKYQFQVSWSPNNGSLTTSQPGYTPRYYDTPCQLMLSYITSCSIFHQGQSRCH